MGVLSGLSRRDLKAVCGLTTEMDFGPGRVLCSQGARGREVFLLIDGQVQVSRDGQPVCVLGSGDILGEMAVLAGESRTATTTTLTGVAAFVLSTAEFGQLLERFPNVASTISFLTATRWPPRWPPPELN
jgi:CRP/FNR family cyclic AMP-dependent transcriptional regulator